MVGYFAAVVINFGDFARFVKNEEEMRKGNLWGLVGKRDLILFYYFNDHRWNNRNFWRICCKPN